MKTIFLKQLKSGNYKLSNETDFTISFDNQSQFVDWYIKNINGTSSGRRSVGSRIIKATYRMSQTYFTPAIYGKEKAAMEVIKFNEKKSN